jgi:hypothetical protein
MLPDYGVVVGRYTGYTTNQGQWLHVDLNIAAGAAQYQAAVDVNEPNGLFQYQVFDNLDVSLFGPVPGLSEGWHHLASTPASGAIDYARSPILQRPLGCLMVFWAVLNSIFRTSGQTWTNVTGNEAGQALLAMVTGLGVHDVHCNQGDPAGPFQHLDGIWQDGCVFATKADGSLSAYLGKFSSQSLRTDNNGLPL